MSSWDNMVKSMWEAKGNASSEHEEDDEEKKKKQSKFFKRIKNLLGYSYADDEQAG